MKPKKKKERDISPREFCLLSIANMGKPSEVKHYYNQ